MNLIANESTIRIGTFLGVLVLMMIWEVFAPRRPLTISKPIRWASNLGLVLLNSFLIRLVLPLGAVGVAIAAENGGLGLFHLVSLPYWTVVLVSLIVLDLAIYLQHVMFHAVPALWRLHMVHHADLDFDVTTGTRFHTIEIALSMGIKAGVVILTGAPPLSVLLFEIALNATSMFNHGNVRVPLGLDRFLRLLVVTPDMHRVHHSVLISEANSNFGFNFPWWDRLMGTYRPQPSAGHEGMTIGVSHLRDPSVDQLHWMLLMPFKKPTGNYPVNRRADS